MLAFRLILRMSATGAPNIKHHRSLHKYDVFDSRIPVLIVHTGVVHAQGSLCACKQASIDKSRGRLTARTLKSMSTESSSSYLKLLAFIC